MRILFPLLTWKLLEGKSRVLHTSFRHQSRSQTILVLSTYPFLNNLQVSLSKSHLLNACMPPISALVLLFFLLYKFCMVISWAFGSFSSFMCGWALHVQFWSTKLAGQVDFSGGEYTWAGKGWNPSGLLEVSVVTFGRAENRGGEWSPQRTKFEEALTQDCELADPALVWPWGWVLTLTSRVSLGNIPGVLAMF